MWEEKRRRKKVEIIIRQNEDLIITVISFGCSPGSIVLNKG